MKAQLPDRGYSIPDLALARRIFRDATREIHTETPETVAIEKNGESFTVKGFGLQLCLRRFQRGKHKMLIVNCHIRNKKMMEAKCNVMQVDFLGLANGVLQTIMPLTLWMEGSAIQHETIPCVTLTFNDPGALDPSYGGRFTWE